MPKTRSTPTQLEYHSLTKEFRLERSSNKSETPGPMIRKRYRHRGMGWGDLVDNRHDHRTAGQWQVRQCTYTESEGGHDSCPGLE
jgi:hypothetical protein